MGNSNAKYLPGLDPRVTHREVRIEADARNLEQMLHRVDIRDEQGTERHFTFYATNPSRSARARTPTPLTTWSPELRFDC